jgi:hypothetical protein
MRSAGHREGNCRWLLVWFGNRWTNLKALLLLQEWVYGTHSTVILSMVEVFREKFASTAAFGCRQDHGIPERNFPTGLKPQPSPKKRQRIFNDKESCEIPND